MVSCSAIPIILAVKHTVLVQTHFHQVPIFQSGRIWCSGWRGPFGCWRKMQRRKKERKLREKSGRNREKKMLGPRPVCIMKMCKKPIHSLFFFFFQFWNTVYTQIFSDKLTGLGSTKLGHNTWTTQINENVGDTCRWKFWTYVAKLIF